MSRFNYIMRKSTIFLLCIIVALFSCNEINRKYYNNGNIKEQYEYIENRSKVKKTTFYKSGSIEKIEFYKDGKLNGTSINFFEDGTISKKVNWNNDTIDGFAVEYYLNGNIKYKSSMENGIKNDSTLVYYKTGELKQVSMYKKGIMTYLVKLSKKGDTLMNVIIPHITINTDSILLGESIKIAYDLHYKIDSFSLGVAHQLFKKAGKTDTINYKVDTTLHFINKSKVIFDYQPKYIGKNEIYIKLFYDEDMYFHESDGLIKKVFVVTYENAIQS